VWDYRDAESGLHHVTWSVRVHHDDLLGQQPVDSAYVTATSEGVHANVRLYDGDRYYLSIHACNGAGICKLDNEVTSVTVDSSPPTAGSVTEDMTWNTGSGSASIKWYGFLDSHTAVEKYHVTINGASGTLLATSDPHTLSIPGAALVTGQRYRVVVVGINSGGLTAAVEAVVEAHPSGQLNTLREVCGASGLCEKQYQQPAGSVTNGCSPGANQSLNQPRSCVCAFAVSYCQDVSVDRATPDATAWANLVVTVYDGFEPNVDIDHQPFTGALGASWAVSETAILFSFLAILYPQFLTCLGDNWKRSHYFAI
jgi:hypothetical protein